MRNVLLLSLSLLALVGCANPDHWRVDSEPVNAKLQVVDDDEVFTYTLPATIEDLDDDMELIVTKPGYERFEGNLADLERVSEKSYKIRLRPIRHSIPTNP